MRRAWLGLTLGVLALPAAAAPRVQVLLGGGPHYVGVPIEIQVRADGFEEDPQPEVEVHPPENATLDLVGVSPQTSSSITIVNGRISQTREVRFDYRYRLLASQPGRLAVGPFRVRQGGVEQSSPPLEIAIRAVPGSDRIGVELLLPDVPLYVGARVPVTLQFRIERELYQNLHDYSLQVPLFDLAGSFRFLDDPDAPGDTEVTVQTAAGALRLKGRLQEQEIDGRPFLFVAVTRTMLPLESGSFEPASPSLVVDEATSFRRDLFGERRATRVRKLRAQSERRRYEVKSVPAEGAPASFAGAVGTGFGLEVAADRTVVQVGEPITLELTVRGGGSLETAGLPPLDAEGLLPADRFRVPDAEVPGVLEEGAKRFHAVVRVLDEDVTEIPALAYSWFDPVTGRYETAHSRPIALSVGESRVIGAGDVVSALPEAARAAPAENAAGARRALPLTGADLSIVRDPELLRRPSGSRGGVWLPAGLYAGSLLLVGGAALDRRRRAEDPAVARRRRRLEDELQEIREAVGRPGDEAVRRVAAALRRMRAECPERAHPELEAFLGECDAHSYAPPELRRDLGGESLCERALALAKSLMEDGP